MEPATRATLTGGTLTRNSAVEGLPISIQRLAWRSQYVACTRHLVAHRGTAQPPLLVMLSTGWSDAAW